LQFALVLTLLSFLPNLLIVMVLARVTGSMDVTLVVAWIAVVGIVSGLLGYVLSHALLRALTRLADEVREGQIGESRADEPSEVASLRGAFRGVLTRLRTEQDRRNAFMATLVHDLKTPLVATGHLVTILRDAPLAPEDRGEVSARLLDENARLLNLVQQMADAHKFEREGVTLQRARVNLADIAAHLVARFTPRARELGVTLAWGGGGQANADAAHLERALSNLIDNALRYAASEVRLDVQPGAVRVTDDGPGLPDALERLAQPFNAQPVEIAGQQFTAGTAGLGLFIVRRVAEAHGGRLAYERADGRSTLEVRLEGA
jgi:signal transduction histidine kinase